MTIFKNYFVTFLIFIFIDLTAVQTITASVFRQELRPILWWTSNGIIMIGSVGYTW